MHTYFSHYPAPPIPFHFDRWSFLPLTCPPAPHSSPPKFHPDVQPFVRLSYLLHLYISLWLYNWLLLICFPFVPFTSSLGHLPHPSTNRTLQICTYLPFSRLCHTPPHFQLSPTPPPQSGEGSWTKMSRPSSKILPDPSFTPALLCSTQDSSNLCCYSCIQQYFIGTSSLHLSSILLLYFLVFLLMSNNPDASTNKSSNSATFCDLIAFKLKLGYGISLPIVLISLLE